MALETITAGDSLEIVGPQDVQDRVLQIIDGDAGFLVPGERGAPQTGDRVTPGRSFRLAPKNGHKEILHAVGEDLTIQSIIQDEVTGGEENRVFGEETGGTEVARKLARTTNTTPGATTDILTNDVTPPETGTLQVKIQVGSLATASVEEDIDGGPEINSDLNDGNDLTAGALNTFAIPCRGDATYNFQIDTGAVEVDILQVDYTREVVV